MSGRDLVLEHLDGRLWPEDLSEEGQAFAKTQYDEYLSDVGDLTVDLDLDNPYYVEDSEDKLSDSGRRARQSGQSRDRRDHSERRASCCPRERVASRGARCQHEPGDRRGFFS